MIHNQRFLTKRYIKGGKSLQKTGDTILKKTDFIIKEELASIKN